ncbi:MAG: hypothetical protein MI919_32225 [Holophagales bacterium]|nr:hypothetical protein [Holophagales bacterium]
MKIARSRILLAVALGFFVLVAMVLLLLTREYDSRELGEALLSQIRSETLEVEADGFRLQPLTGLEMRGLRLRSLSSDGTMSIDVGRVIVTHRFASIFSGRWVFEEIVLEEPAIEVVWAVPEAGGSARGPGPAPGAVPPPATEGAPRADAAEAAQGGGEPSFTLELRRLGLERGTFVMRDEGSEAATLELERLGVDLRELGLEPGATDVLSGLEAHGEVTASVLEAVDLVRAENARGRLRLGGGHVRLEDLGLPMAMGVLTLRDVDVDLARESLAYTVEVAGDPLQTQKILGASSGFGDASLALDLAGVGTDPVDAEGEGALTVGAGQLGDAPAIVALERLLVGTDLIGRPYEAFESRFRIADASLELLPFEIRAGDLAFGLHGAAGFDGVLDLRLELSMPRDDVDIDELPKEALEALTGADGRVRLPLVIRGPADGPSVGFDQEVLKRILAESLAREAERQIGKALGRLFGDG